MNRREAIQYLHDRHSDVIDPPEHVVDLEAFHFELCWFQSHACELIDARAQADLRRCFATIHDILVKGDREVRDAVSQHFVIPDLVFHPELAWARQHMPPLLAELCGKMRQALDEEFARGPTGIPGE
jgi:hypothetical protein